MPEGRGLHITTLDDDVPLSHLTDEKQARILDQQREQLRWLWNTLLAERKTTWEARQDIGDRYDQRAQLPLLKSPKRPKLKEVHSHV